MASRQSDHFRLAGLRGGEIRKYRGYEGPTMFRWALIFLFISLVAAVFGFGGISFIAVHLAQVLFYIFLAGFAVFLVAGLLG